MTNEEMNFERCQALEESRNLRKQNAILVKALKEINERCIDGVRFVNQSAEAHGEDAMKFGNFYLEENIKTINKALREKAIKK